MRSQPVGKPCLGEKFRHLVVYMQSTPQANAPPYLLIRLPIPSHRRQCDRLSHRQGFVLRCFRRLRCGLRSGSGALAWVVTGPLAPHARERPSMHTCRRTAAIGRGWWLRARGAGGKQRITAACRAGGSRGHSSRHGFLGRDHADAAAEGASSGIVGRAGEWLCSVGANIATRTSSGRETEPLSHCGRELRQQPARQLALAAPVQGRTQRS